jgi:single-strand DNA-binding protein
MTRTADARRLSGDEMKRMTMMAGSVNKVTLLGNVGSDPDIRVGQSGRKIASFSVATNDSWTDKASGEKKERTEWHRVVVFNEHLAKVVEDYVQKGDKIYLEGSNRTRKWQAQDGTDRYTTEIHIQAFGGELVLLGRPNGQRADSGASASTRAGSAAAPRDDRSPAPDLDDEVPF